MKNMKQVLMLSALTLLLSACQTPEQMAEREAQQAAKAEAKAAERTAKAAAKMAGLENKLPDGFERVVGDDLLQTVSERTITGVSSSNSAWRYTVYRDADGAMKGVSVNGSDKSEDSGKWWIESDKVCSQWNSWSDGKLICNRLYSNGEYFMTISEDGKINDGKKLKWTNEAGNVANL